MKSVTVISQSGCFLPLLIALNLFFGWVFFKPLIWVGIGLILILLFLLNSIIINRRIKSSFKRKDFIDVEGKILD